MEPLAEHHEVPEKKPDTGEDQEQRFRGTVSYVMSVLGTVAAFAAGFGLLPSSTSAEKVLNVITVIGVSGAIIFGIGAWRSGRRFMLMTISAGLAFTCLAALLVVAQTASGAQGPPSPPFTPSPGSSQLTSGTGSPGPTGSTAAPTGQGGAIAASVGYRLMYSKQKFTMPGDSCQSGYPYVLFTLQGPSVTVINGFPIGSYDMFMSCVSQDPDILFGGQVAFVSGNPDANTCYTTVKRIPIGGNAIQFSQLNSDKQVCMIDNSSDELILVTLLSVSDSTYDTSWSATVWSLPPNS